jgi:protein arginine N-methyltransferase 2
MSSDDIPVEHHSSTKPDYLSHRLRYNSDNTALLDADDDAVMMEWERPLMKAHAQILTGEVPGKRVMNVGFGMGIIDTALQEYNPSLHIIIEAHPDVYKRMLDQKWDQKPNVKLCHGRWQDVLPQLIREGVELDGVFFDTYAEHSFDMEDFHVLMSQILSKPQGVYSFFNGLAPDNLFFHGVGKLVVILGVVRL